MSRYRCPAIALVALAALTWTNAAQAQQAGVYVGTSADGENVSFIVGTDPNTKKLAVLGATVSMNVECRGMTQPVNTMWGFGFTHDITNGKAYFSYSDIYFYVTTNFVFSGSSVTGFITSRTAVLPPGNAAPNQAAFCISARQAFSAAVSGDATAAVLPPGTVMRYPAAR